MLNKSKKKSKNIKRIKKTQKAGTLICKEAENKLAQIYYIISDENKSSDAKIREISLIISALAARTNTKRITHTNSLHPQTSSFKPSKMIRPSNSFNEEGEEEA